MKYRIGEIASLLNLSPQSLRKYETEGLIAPQKDASSAYRYYSGWDLILLSACRQYRALDFSLNETNQMLMCSNPESVTDFLRHQEAALERLIEEYTRKKDTVVAWRKQVEQHFALAERFNVEENEDTYCLIYQKGDQLLQDTELRILLTEWYGYIPYVYCAIQLPIASYPHDLQDFSVGMCVAAQALPFLGITDTAPLRHYPRRRCLHTAMVLDQEAFQSGEPYHRLSRYAAEHGLQLDERGQFVCRLNLICKGDTGLRFFVDCYAPLA